MTMEKLTLYQKEMINKFSPPRYYRWFYRIYQKMLKYILFFGLLSCFFIGLLQSVFYVFNIILGILMVCGTIALIALSAFLTKHVYTIIYAKNIGLTLKEWNYWTQGMVFKYIK